MEILPKPFNGHADAGADLHEKDMNGMTVIHWAALAGRAETVKLLAARGADINAVDSFGYTPLLYAATVDFGDSRTASALLDAHADWKLADKNGKTGVGPFSRLSLHSRGPGKSRGGALICAFSIPQLANRRLADQSQWSAFSSFCCQARWHKLPRARCKIRLNRQILRI